MNVVGAVGGEARPSRGGMYLLACASGGPVYLVDATRGARPCPECRARMLIVSPHALTVDRRAHASRGAP